MKTPTIYITLTLEFQQEGHRWIGVCKELGTSTYSRSLPETEKQLKEAVFLHLNTLEDIGERERFFKEHGIEIHHIRPKSETIEIPTSRKNVYYRPHIQKLPAPSMC